MSADKSTDCGHISVWLIILATEDRRTEGFAKTSETKLIRVEQGC